MLSAIAQITKISFFILQKIDFNDLHDKTLSAVATYCSDMIVVKKSVIDQTIRANEQMSSLAKNDTAKLRKEYTEAQQETKNTMAKENYLKKNIEEHDSHIIRP